jgi:hypothetical protein
MAVSPFRAPRGRQLILIALFGLLVPFALGSSFMVFNDGDVSWHVANGRWIIAHGEVPRTDHFSFTLPGQRWVSFEWLSDVVYAAAYRLAGYSGLAAIVSLALSALYLTVLLHLRRFAGNGVLLTTALLLSFILIPFLSARPHLLAWPILAVWTMIMIRASDERRAPALGWSALILLWANLHGSWALGLAIAALLALDTLIAAKWDRKLLLGWLMFGLVSAAMAMLTPNGLDGFLHPLRVSQMETLQLVKEWRPSDVRTTPWFFAALGVTIAAMLWRRPRLSPVRALLIVALTAMALYQMRHQAVLAIVAALVLAPAFGTAPSEPVADNPKLHRLLAGGLAAAVALLAIVRLVLPLVPSENEANPRRALSAIPPELRHKPVFNGYTLGGPLILAGTPVYIDGRQDFYGDRFLLDYKRMLDGDMSAFERDAVRRGITWTILPAKGAKLVAKLDSSPRWRRLYADRSVVIHVRR